MTARKKNSTVPPTAAQNGAAPQAARLEQLEAGIQNAATQLQDAQLEVGRLHMQLAQAQMIISSMGNKLREAGLVNDNGDIEL